MLEGVLVFLVIWNDFYEINLLFSNIDPGRENDEVACRATLKPYQGLTRSPGYY